MGNKYDDLEKISTVIFPIGQNLTFKMNVRLSYKNKDGNKQMFVSEVKYFSNKYNNKKKITNMNLSPNYYLSLENIKGNDTFIKITTYTLPSFKKALKKLVDWFYYSEPGKPGLYVYMDGKLTLNKELVMKYKISSTVFFQDNKSIKMTPSVFKDINGVETEAVLFIIEDKMYYVMFDAFEGMYDILSNFNMYQTALTLMNFIGRPEFGTYEFDFENRKDDDFFEPKEFSKCTYKPQKSPKDLKGFFD